MEYGHGCKLADLSLAIKRHLERDFSNPLSLE